MMLNNIHSETLVISETWFSSYILYNMIQLHFAKRAMNLDAEAADGPLTVLVIGWASVVSVAQSLLWNAMVKKGLK